MFNSLEFIFFIIILFYSIIFHEVAHGYAAYRNGDNTALERGRLTLNPISHIDLIGSIIIPILSYSIFKTAFGWAKPVPYNPNNIKNKKYAELEVASAGILINFFLAIFALALFYIFSYFGILNIQIAYILKLITSINIFLAIFNLLPFPPADGFSIFSELYIHSKALINKIKNLFTKNKEYNVYYKDNPYTSRNQLFKIKALFSNPFVMILIIYFAIQIFSFFIPYINNFINYLYSF